MWAGSLLRSVGITAKELQCGSSASGTLTWLKWWSRVCCWFSTPNSGWRAERKKKDDKKCAEFKVDRECVM